MFVVLKSLCVCCFKEFVCLCGCCFDVFLCFFVVVFVVFMFVLLLSSGRCRLFQRFCGVLTLFLLLFSTCLFVVSSPMSFKVP